jgi:mannonate dehydratase
VPIAERWQVQLACHLDDPPYPSLRGVERWDWPVFEGLRRFCSVVDSPYHGLNLCLGTTAEGLADSTAELPQIIQHLGERKKIFNVHFRNIVSSGVPGRAGHQFHESWPDEGDSNMFALARALHDVGYEYMLMCV